MQLQKIAVVGAGPIGGILAAELVQAGHEVSVIDVSAAHVEAMRRDGLIVDLETGPRVSPINSTYATVEAAAAAGARFDAVFVCTKATINQFVVPGLPQILGSHGAAVSFQNGLDAEASLLEAVGPGRALRGVVNYAGSLVAPGHVKRTFFNPPNFVGPADSANQDAATRAEALALALNRTALTTSYSAQIQRHVWEKVIRNAALMPISALTGQTILQCVESARGLFLVEALLKEALAVAAALGIEFDQKFYDGTLEYFRKAGHHMPSMWFDVQEKRQTEIAFLNHKIAEYGEAHGVAVPYNRALANCLLCIDELALAQKAK